MTLITFHWHPLILFPIPTFIILWPQPMTRLEELLTDGSVNLHRRMYCVSELISAATVLISSMISGAEQWRCGICRKYIWYYRGKSLLCPMMPLAGKYCSGRSMFLRLALFHLILLTKLAETVRIMAGVFIALVILYR